MSLATPDKIRDLQIKLYRKAKDEPEFRFISFTTRCIGKTSCGMHTLWPEPIMAGQE
jgi:hypothetical protein